MIQTSADRHVSRGKQCVPAVVLPMETSLTAMELLSTYGLATDPNLYISAGYGSSRCSSSCKANRYHYNEEAIKIAVASTTVDTVYITKVGIYEFTDTTKSGSQLA